MMKRLKAPFIFVSLIAVNFIVNFWIYNYSFNVQATPYLHEEQRVESGLLMLKTTLPAYLISSIALTLIVYVAVKIFMSNDPKEK